MLRRSSTTAGLDQARALRRVSSAQSMMDQSHLTEVDGEVMKEAALAQVFVREERRIKPSHLTVAADFTPYV